MGSELELLAELARKLQGEALRGENAPFDERLDALARQVGESPAGAIRCAEDLITAFPDQGDPYVIGALAALLCNDPKLALRLLRRLRRRFLSNPVDQAVEGMALLHARQVVAAAKPLRRAGVRGAPDLYALMPVRGRAIQQLVTRTFALAHAPQRPKQVTPSARRAPTERTRAPRGSGRSPEQPATEAVAARTVSGPLLAMGQPELRISLRLPDACAIAELLDARGESDPDWFRLRGELAELSLFEGFDELLCLPTLRGVERYWYQIETARKVLKQFKGRVLLADEVGLGKTIEAAMVLKEYALRGMAERALILTPPSLVGQWQEELSSKFALEFSSTSDPLFRSDPAGLWRESRIIASLAAARRDEHKAALAAAPPFDLVIVDEAHRLKNRSTRSYALVHGLRTRFLLLLSATPVENNLVELYNLLTLLQPGIFETEREFRAAYMTRGSPRTPRNREALRTLMRDVMIRNTRALVDLRLPPRQALTVAVEPGVDESSCYRELSEAVARAHAQGGHPSLALRQLLHAAGSSPQAAARALERKAAAEPGLAELAARYRALGPGAKERALLELLAKNPEEKKLVFVGQLATLDHLSALLGERGVPHARFDGSLPASAKDAATAAFRDRYPVLLCSESGGEGRNLQFCNTVIHFDLPWNPMAIEQRIGRVHRIGQTREVFVFNLVTRHTVEDALLEILNEKLNLFELVVGEVDAILGELDQELDFAERVYRAWVEATPGARERALDPLGEQLLHARGQYEAARALDEELFGDELEVG
jgi:superfamily II DNA or RNA helicase